ncbi:MAG: response regulator transcription factor [Bacteroidia bacterium]|nr:response regulator transcription factor [Bacteroidia bacterium]
MKALLVDDEQHCRENLSILLNRHCPEIKEIRTADSVDNAVIEIKEANPDILFLDISMPEKDGFHLLNLVDTSDMCIVFVTAHDEYALRAIKCGPTAYILKPVDIDELVEAVALVVKQQKAKYNTLGTYQEAIKNLTRTLEQRSTPDRICLSHASKLQIVRLEDIVLLSSDSYYTTFYMSDKSKIVMSKTLKYYQEALTDRFIRVHRSHLVNSNHVEEFHYEMSELSLSSGIRIPVSRRKVNEVVERLKTLA